MSAARNPFMSAATIDADVLIARNPSTGQPIATIRRTPPDAVAGLVARARSAQAVWAETSWRERSATLDRWRRAIARDAGGWARAMGDEVGKPMGEALGEVITSLDAIRWTARHGRKALADERLGPGLQRLLLVPTARLRWRPLGVVGMIGTWNYPLLLNAPPIAQAIFAGNAVVWKPSELAPGLGKRLEESLRDIGLPDGLVATVQGGGEVGAALVASGIDKGVFTGGIENGRHVLAELGRRGIPAVVELSGFDAAIVGHDAPLESTADALAWAAFVGSGQACVATKRVFVIGDPFPLADALARRAKALRVGDPSRGEIDVGPMISESARDRFSASIRASEAAGARPLAGGRPLDGPGWFYVPTVLLAHDAEPESKLAGCFGPVVVVRGVATGDEAVASANASPFGLAASVWGRDRRETKRLADRLEVGMVSINDAVAPSAHAAAPFGGVKASGFGRTKGRLGLWEFVQPQTITARGPGGFRPQVFPYSGRLARLIGGMIRLMHRR
jgi:acyl-CoA reductase-like NAD-dependent aldehyde dehydrogenase